MLSLMTLNSVFNYKMMEFKDRLKQARNTKGISQSKLADKVGVHVTNISRYERGENKPTSQVLTRLASALQVSTDFLMSGTTDDRAKAAISDEELLEQFRKVEMLSNDKKYLVKEFLDAFLMKAELQQKLAS